jgi:hypothetical protein
MMTQDKEMKRLLFRKKKKFLFIIPLVIVAMALFTLLFQKLWNCVIPDVFKLNTISYWQALGILVISKILFSGRFGGHNMRGKFRGKFKRFNENLSDEDRNKLREEWRNRCRNRYL